MSGDLDLAVDAVELKVDRTRLRNSNPACGEATKDITTKTARLRMKILIP
jgi:hypothetical protein